MTVTLLGAILESALERELIGRNPARGRGRRVRERAPAPQLSGDAPGRSPPCWTPPGSWTARRREERKHIERRAILSTMILSGLRIGELCALRWRDVDLAAGWLTVGESKTDAGRRQGEDQGRAAR